MGMGAGRVKNPVCTDCHHEKDVDFWCPRCDRPLCATCSDFQGRECLECREG